MSSMLEENPPPGEDAPLPINGGTAAVVQAALVSVALASITVIGAVTSILSFWKARDLAGWMTWLRSSDALQAISALTLLGGFAGLIVRSARRKWREIFLARHAPNDIAFIVGEQNPPPPIRAPEPATAAPRIRLVDPAGLLD